jgi:hypothetical protein
VIRYSAGAIACWIKTTIFGSGPRRLAIRFDDGTRFVFIQVVSNDSDETATTDAGLVLLAVSSSSSTSVSRGPTATPVQVVTPAVTTETSAISSRHEEIELDEPPENEGNRTREALSSQGSEQNSVSRMTR